MIQSSVTVCLVPEIRGGPFVFWDDLEEGCRQARELGFDAIELYPRCAQAVDRARLKDVLSQYRLRLSAVATGAGYVLNRWHLCSEDESNRKRAYRFIADLIDLASDFGAPVILGSMKGFAERRAESKRVLARLEQTLDSLACRAAEQGVSLLLEPLNRYETNIINRLEEAFDLIASLGAGNVRILADLFHMNIEEDSICEAFKKCATALGYVHLVDSNRRPAGLGHINFADVGEVLRQVGFRGYVSAEALPYPDSRGAAARTMEVFRRDIAQGAAI
jgi:sugar phosphate isomerase/epimerase